MRAPRLTRDLVGMAAPQPRIVHLGLGAFHRAHQAWYTSRAGDGRHWGIAGFTGRSPRAASLLQRQGGLYTVIERSVHADRFEVVPNIVRSYDGSDLSRFTELCSADETAMITLTVTEAGYCLTPEGKLDFTAPAVVADRRQLLGVLGGSAIHDRPITTTPGRLVLGLEARRRAGGAPIAVVSCDNLPANGDATRDAVLELSDAVSGELSSWIRESVSFVNTSVDRITPRTTRAELALVADECGWEDLAPIVTEPFHDWVLNGRFPAGRPRWEDSGALFVDDIEPYENRKLWLLNGAHSLLAYSGLLRGHETVSQALDDSVCASWMQEFWDEAEQHLPPELGLSAYRADLMSRFGNSRIRHSLAQIAMAGSSKLRVRVVPILQAEREAGRRGTASARAIACWLEFVVRSPGDLHDDHLQPALSSATTPRERLRRVLEVLSPELAAEEAFLGELADLGAEV